MSWNDASHHIRAFSKLYWEAVAQGFLREDENVMTYLWHISSDDHSIICVYCLLSLCLSLNGLEELSSLLLSYFINSDNP